MKYLKKYISDGEQLLRTAVFCFTIFPLLAVITERSKLVIDLYYLIMFIGVFHTLLVARLMFNTEQRKVLVVGFVLSLIGILNSVLFMLGIINEDTAPNWVIIELIIITIILWGISLIKSLRS